MALVVNFFVTPFFVLMPFHVSGVLHGDAFFYGLLMAILSAGVLTGYLAAARVPFSRATRSSFVVCVIACMCGSFLLFSQLSAPYFAAMALFAAGLANGYWSIFFETAIQSVIPRESLGRVYACYGLFSGGLIPVASLVGGVILDVLNQDTRMLFSFCAAIMTAYPLVLLSSRRFVSFFDCLKSVSQEG
jgi:drug/metabolite transporter superfamily protein YnfA